MITNAALAVRQRRIEAGANEAPNVSRTEPEIPSSVLALVRQLVPLVVAEVIAAVESRQQTTARKAEAMSARWAQRKMNGLEISEALGLGEYVVYAVKKANKLAHERGEEPLIFTGRYSSPEAVSTWLDAHPSFIARRVLRRECREWREAS